MQLAKESMYKLTQREAVPSNADGARRSVQKPHLVRNPLLYLTYHSKPWSGTIDVSSVQWKLRNKTLIRAMKSGLIFEVVLILRTIMHVYMDLGLTKVVLFLRWSLYRGGRLVECPFS